ncbi:MAG: four helix bundle protein [Balneola sp.]
MDDKSQNINSFEDLLVWQKCKKLRQSISKFCDTLPKNEEYRLKDQLIRASRSVTANIAEGYGRFHFQENIQYCRQARGSLYEVLDHLSCALDEGYISQEDFDKYKISVINCIQIINGYINYLKSAKVNFVKEESINYTLTNNE